MQNEFVLVTIFSCSIYYAMMFTLRYSVSSFPVNKVLSETLVLINFCK